MIQLAEFISCVEPGYLVGSVRVNKLTEDTVYFLQNLQDSYEIAGCNTAIVVDDEVIYIYDTSYRRGLGCLINVTNAVARAL